MLSIIGSTHSFVQPSGSRPGYIHDDADVISSDYDTRLDEYARQLNDATTAEIVVYMISSFEGHGISKDGIEIQERDMLANFIFNEVPLDGVRVYNTHLRTFPNNMFNQDGFLDASAWALQSYPPYEAAAGAQTDVPDVDLTN